MTLKLVLKLIIMRTKKRRILVSTIFKYLYDTDRIYLFHVRFFVWFKSRLSFFSMWWKWNRSWDLNDIFVSFVCLFVYLLQLMAFRWEGFRVSDRILNRMDSGFILYIEISIMDKKNQKRRIEVIFEINFLLLLYCN